MGASLSDNCSKPSQSIEGVPTDYSCCSPNSHWVLENPRDQTSAGASHHHAGGQRGRASVQDRFSNCCCSETNYPLHEVHDPHQKRTLCSKPSQSIEGAPTEYSCCSPNSHWVLENPATSVQKTSAAGVLPIIGSHTDGSRPAYTYISSDVTGRPLVRHLRPPALLPASSRAKSPHPRRPADACRRPSLPPRSPVGQILRQRPPAPPRRPLRRQPAPQRPGLLGQPRPRGAAQPAQRSPGQPQPGPRDGQPGRASLRRGARLRAAHPITS